MTHLPERRVRIVFHRDVGNLFHYGHFIVDGVIPFIPVYRQLCEQSTTDVVEMLLMEKPDQHLSQFTYFWSHFFPRISRVTYVPENVFRQHTEIPLHHVHGQKFGPYSRHDLEYAEQHLGWSSLGSQQTRPMVLVIERGNQPLRLASCIRANAGDTGARRRRLDNQQEINQVIRDVCHKKKWDLHIVQLEDMPISEQHRLFASADIIVGQHGAGLCNLVFSTRRRSHVFEISHWGLKTIQHLAQAKDLRHCTVRSSMKWCCPHDLRQKVEAISLSR